MLGSGVPSSPKSPRGKALKLLAESKRKAEAELDDVSDAPLPPSAGGIHKSSSWEVFNARSLPAKLRRQDTLEQRKSQIGSLSVSLLLNLGSW